MGNCTPALDAMATAAPAKAAYTTVHTHVNELQRGLLGVCSHCTEDMSCLSADRVSCEAQALSVFMLSDDLRFKLPSRAGHVCMRQHHIYIFHNSMQVLVMR
jgi:hypothetical protein